MMMLGLWMVLTGPVLAYGISEKEALKEDRSSQLLRAVLTHDKLLTTLFQSEDLDLLVGVLWDLQENQETPPSQLDVTLQQLPLHQLSLLQRLQLAILKNRRQLPDDTKGLAQELLMQINDVNAGPELARLFLALRDDLERMNLSYLVKVATQQWPNVAEEIRELEVPQELDPVVVRDLWEFTPPLQGWREGAYAHGARLYMFCRSNRHYPCLMLMRGSDHKPIRQADGTLWTQPALADSANDLPSYQRNGSTPAGIHTLDGVMPTANNHPAYGKYRRIILRFIPASPDEALHKTLLPPTSLTSTWWHADVVARKLGRDSLRIHGTGRINDDPNSPWYPLTPTLGCVSKLENTYDGVTYRHQRELLDTILTAMKLPATYAKQPAIKGLLYLIELNSDTRSVTLSDLNAIGIQ